MSSVCRPACRLGMGRFEALAGGSGLEVRTRESRPIGALGRVLFGNWPAPGRQNFNQM